MPYGELFSDSIEQLAQNREESIVGAQPARELPDSLHVVEFRAIGREEIKRNALPMLAEPWSYVDCLVVTGIIQDHDQFSVLSAMAKEKPKEGEERARVELLLCHSDEPSVGSADCAHDPDALARGGEEDDGIDILRRNPHV